MHRLIKTALFAVIAAAATVIFTAPAGRAYADEMTPIMGEAVLTESQMLRYLDSVYPDAPDVVKTLPAMYLEEGALEGVRGDIAFAQACLETGTFIFPSSTAVKLEQWNFAGLGVTENGMTGNSFASPREGVRAQIQHLKAYATDEPLASECVDQRFSLVKRESARYVEWLGIQENPEGLGWASGEDYGPHVLAWYDRIAAFESDKEEPEAEQEGPAAEEEKTDDNTEAEKEDMTEVLRSFFTPRPR
ncbi:MAG: glucosaminidase domain-containing protein [Lachnospiraceae bacterium]|nr:glucosaminidase domain-containing protein [Lachnospiraceae bacterium]